MPPIDGPSAQIVTSAAARALLPAVALLALYDGRAGGDVSAGVPTALVCAIAASRTRDVAAVAGAGVQAALDALDAMPFNARSIDLRAAELDGDGYDRLVATLAANPRHGHVQELYLRVSDQLQLVDRTRFHRLPPALRGCRKLRRLEIVHDCFFFWTPLIAGAEALMRSVVIKGLALSRLERAAAQGLWLTVQRLAGGEAEVRGRGALLHAANNGHVDVVRWLAAAGGDLEAPSLVGSRTALSLAAIHGETAAMQCLIDCGCDIHARDDKGSTALALCAAVGNVAVAQWLLDAGLDLHTKATDGSSVLFDAATAGAPAVAFFLRLGLDPNGASDDGTTPLMLAANSGRCDAVRALLDAGGGCDAADKRGCTALMFAAHNHEQRAVELLLAAGCDKAHQMAGGFTARDVALMVSDIAIAELLS
jgi:ankyrin repeat protein